MAKMLKAEQVAERLGICQRSAHYLIENGKLAAYNVSTGDRPTWRVSEEDLQAFLISRRSTNQPRQRDAAKS